MILKIKRAFASKIPVGSPFPVIGNVLSNTISNPNMSRYIANDFSISLTNNVVRRNNVGSLSFDTSFFFFFLLSSSYYIFLTLYGYTNTYNNATIVVVLFDIFFF